MNNDKSNTDQSRATKYSLAIGAVALGSLLRYGMNVWVGPLPTYITFYPAVMLAALLGGFGPGIMATMLVTVVVDWWLLLPVGFGIASFPDAVGIGLFSFMGLFMSVVAELYRRTRVKAAAYDREVTLREINQQKEFLANILQQASQSFAVGYIDGHLGLLNNAFEQLTGYSGDELRSLDWAKGLTPPEWRDIEQKKLEYLRRTGQPVRYEKEYIRKDGTRVPIELLVHLMNDAEGNPEYYYSFITDITERRQAEESLRKSEERYRLLFETMLQGVVYQDADGKIISMNPAAERILGKTLEKLSGPVLEEPEHPALREDGSLFPGHEHAAAKSLRTGRQTQAMLAQVYNPIEQGYRWLNISAVPQFRPGEAAPYQVYTVIEDITERKYLELALQNRMQEQQTILDSVPAMVFYKDTENRFIRINKAFEDAMGVAKNELEGKSLFDLYPAEQAEAYWRDDQEVMASGQAKCGIIEPMGTPAGTRLVQTDKVPYLDETGTVSGVIGFALDITERKQAEQALRESREDLNRAQAVAHIGSWRLNVQRNELLWSEENHRIFGVPEGTPLIYDTFLSIVHPDDRTYVHEKWSAALSGEPYDIEHRIIADGAVKWVRERATLEFDSTDALLGGFGTTQDISEKKQAEIELEEARNAAVKDKNLLEAVMEAIPVGVAITTVQGGTIRANRMFDQVWGQPRPETSSFKDYNAYKAWWLDTGQPVQPEEWASARAVQNGETVVGQLLEIEQFDGAHRFVINSAAPFLDAVGNIAGSAVAIQDVTTRIEAEKALRQSEQMYRAIGESIDYGVWVCDSDGRNTYASESFLNLVGITQQQCSDFGWGDVLHPDDAERTIAAWKECAQTGGKWDIEHRFRGVDGQWHPVLARGVPVRDEQGQINRWAGINLDISRLKGTEEALHKINAELELRVQERTEMLNKVNELLREEIDDRKRIEITVRESEEQFRSLIHTAPVIIVSLAPDGAILEFNPEAELAYGRTRAEVLGKNYLDLFIPAEQHDMVAGAVKRVLAGEPISSYENPIRNADGSELFYIWNIDRVLDDRGNPSAIIAVGHDVTERRKMLEALEAAAAYTRNIIEASLDPLVTINRDGKVTDLNKATEQIVNLPREQIIGTGFSDYFTESKKAQRVYEHVFKRGFVRNYPLAIKGRFGVVRDVLYNATVYRNSAGEIEGVFAAARDISKRKRAEKRLRESEKRLKLLSSRLLEVQEQERKSIATELHDSIASSLTAVILGLSRARPAIEACDPQYRDIITSSINMLQNAIDETRQLMNSLRPPMLDDFGLISSIRWFTEQYRALYPQLIANTEITLEERVIPAQLKIVLFRIIQEAFTNIAKHSRAQTATLYLKQRENAIDLVIADNGAGFDPEAVNSKQELYKGLGIMSMKERAELSGGNLSIDTDRGQGTIISASWPIRP